MGLPTRRAGLRTVIRASAAIGLVCSSVIGLAEIEPAHGDPSWTIMASPSPGPNAELRGVACSTDTSCMAVGDSYDLNGPTKTLAVRWNGTTWSRVSTPNLSGSDSELDAVSCPSRTTCLAVGHRGNETLIERWNGATWSRIASPNPAGLRINDLSAVTCRAASSCFAVGHSEGAALTERWNGRTWVIVPGTKHGLLQSVACPGPASCFAVGNDNSVDEALIEHWNGTTWTAVPSPARHGGGELDGVTCPTSDGCFAVGSYLAVPDGVVEQWNGTDWSITPSPIPVGSTFHGLDSVSCRTTTSCVAVGGIETATVAEKTLIERWDGAQWSLTSSPNPTGTTQAVLTGVRCPTTGHCFAVGFFHRGSAARTLIERYA